MLKKLLLVLFSFLASCCDKPAKPHTVQTMDSKELLFSLPTLSDPIPSTQPGPPPSKNRHLHEDDWRQVEFVPIADREYIQSKLVELATFKQQHRHGQGFTQIFIRSEHPVTFQSVDFTATQLPRFSEFSLTLGSVPLPNGLGLGMVPGGFALSDGGDWFIYGQCTPDGHVLSLAISPGHTAEPTQPFARALAELAGKRFLLVDWYLGAVVDTSSPESILIWARRFQ